MGIQSDGLGASAKCQPAILVTSLSIFFAVKMALR